MEYSIGEFSRMTRMTVKTLRLYHEEGLIVPRVDGQTGYRYYHPAAVDRAALVARLRAWDFSLREIRDVVDHCSNDQDLGPVLERKAREVAAQATRYIQMRNEIELFRATLKEESMKPTINAVIEKTLPETLVVSVRYRGSYDQVGEAFGRLFRTFGRWTAGSPFVLYHDAEYRDDDADIEACLPLRKEVSLTGLETKWLEGGRALCLVHPGPYDTLGRAYRTLAGVLATRGWTAQVPSREVYLKGPGGLFPRRPAHYLTEVQMPLLGR